MCIRCENRDLNKQIHQCTDDEADRAQYVDIHDGGDQTTEHALIISGILIAGCFHLRDMLLQSLYRPEQKQKCQYQDDDAHQTWHKIRTDFHYLRLRQLSGTDNQCDAQCRVEDADDHVAIFL